MDPTEPTAPLKLTGGDFISKSAQQLITATSLLKRYF
jgi:hypothetical protein